MAENSGPKEGIKGFVEDVKGNEAARFGNGGLITVADSAKAFVIPTNEELVIAQGAARFA